MNSELKLSTKLLRVYGVRITSTASHYSPYFTIPVLELDHIGLGISFRWVMDRGLSFRDHFFPNTFRLALDRLLLDYAQQHT